MDALGVDDLDDAYDELVLATPDVDRFCTSGAWVRAADRHLHPPRDDALVADHVDGGRHVLALRRLTWTGLRILEPLEANWGLASPLVGPRLDVAAPRLAQHLLGATDAWDVLALSGLPTRAPWVEAFGDALARGGARVVRGWPLVRHVARLDDGADAWLARRSPRFRRNLRRAARAADARGVTIETAHDLPVARTCARMQRVEARSWKRDAALSFRPGASFYGDLAVRLATAGRLRVLFARLDDADVGYCLGGVFGDTYRGLQFSYDEDFAELSLGNLMQRRQIDELVADGVPRYDLGTTADHYKRRWADGTAVSVSLRAVAPGVPVTLRSPS